jgi:hypothetical protein
MMVQNVIKCGRAATRAARQLSSFAKTATMSSSVSFVVGNTYHTIREANAKLDRSRSYRRIHDWTVYVDILSGDPDIIDHVIFDMQNSTFRPQVFKHHAPTRIPWADGRTRRRFATRQQTYGTITCKVTLVGRGGSIMTLNHAVRTHFYEAANPYRFLEERPQKPWDRLQFLMSTLVSSWSLLPLVHRLQIKSPALSQTRLAIVLLS